MVHKIGNFSPNTNLSTMLFLISLHCNRKEKSDARDLRKQGVRGKTAMLQNANNGDKAF